MRIVLLLVFALALGACGKKNPPQGPTSSSEEQMEREVEEKDLAAPLEEDDPESRSADPQEGGE